MLVNPAFYVYVPVQEHYRYPAPPVSFYRYTVSFYPVSFYRYTDQYPVELFKRFIGTRSVRVACARAPWSS